MHNKHKHKIKKFPKSAHEKLRGWDRKKNGLKGVIYYNITLFRNYGIGTLDFGILF